MHQPERGGVKNEPHLIGGGAVARHAIGRQLRLVQLDQPAAGVPREKLAAIVEQIQVGTSDDGTAALEELVGLMNAGRPKTEQFSREDVGQIVQQTIVARETQTEIDGALKTFRARRPLDAEARQPQVPGRRGYEHGRRAGKPGPKES